MSAASDIVVYIPDDGDPTPEQLAMLAYLEGVLEAGEIPGAPKADMPDGITVDGHLFVHVAACPCPRIQREVARLAPHAPDREIGYTAFECERDMQKLGGHCADPEEHRS